VGRVTERTGHEPNTLWNRTVGVGPALPPVASFQFHEKHRGLYPDATERGSMTFVVPFDGSEQSRLGLERAVELAPSTVPVVSFSVVPRGHEKWARERELVDDDAEYHLETVLSTLRDRVADVDERIQYRHETVDRFAPTGKISHEIRSFARGNDATMVFVGSENAGSFVSSLRSVGTHVASDDAYDVVIVRRAGSVVP